MREDSVGSVGVAFYSNGDRRFLVSPGLGPSSWSRYLPSLALPSLTLALLLCMCLWKHPGRQWGEVPLSPIGEGAGCHAPSEPGVDKKELWLSVWVGSLGGTSWGRLRALDRVQSWELHPTGLGV